MNKAKKKHIKPKELLIKAVVEELKPQMDEPSIKNDDKSKQQGSAFGNAFLSSTSGEADYTSRVEGALGSETSVGAPAGLVGATKILQADENKSSSSSGSKPEPPAGKEADKTMVLPMTPAVSARVNEGNDGDKTAVLGSKPQPTVTQQPRPQSVQKPMTRLQNIPTPAPSPRIPSAMPNVNPTGFEGQFMQSENLKIAQVRIHELEREIEELRKENEILASANELSKQKTDDLLQKVQNLERTKSELKESNESELKIFRDGMYAKDSEVSRLKDKVEELEARLANDLRKIRVRERELENRLELSKLERNALMRSKDENILDLKRRCEIYETEIESFQKKVFELNKKIESNQDQFSRTVRALRIALTNLEVNENTSSITLAPVKKAE